MARPRHRSTWEGGRGGGVEEEGAGWEGDPGRGGEGRRRALRCQDFWARERSVVEDCGCGSGVRN